MVPALQFAVFRCKTVKQRADMFAFKWLCTSTDSRSAPCNHILWAPAPTLQNTWFLRISRFLSRACKKMGCKLARLQHMPALFLSCCFRKWNLNGPQMQEPTRGDLFISPSLFLFFFLLLRHNSANKAAKMCVRKTVCGNIGRVPLQGVACFSEWVNADARGAKHG